MNETTETLTGQRANQSNGEHAPSITLDQLVNLCIEKEASDIHFREGGRMALRVSGKLVFIENAECLSREDTMSMIYSLLPGEEYRNRLNNEKEIDFSYTHKNGVNFRVNVFYQKGKLAGVLRMVKRRIPTMEELRVPEIMKHFIAQRQGLIIIGGAPGTGKSTTIQSILQFVNENHVKHILTIENPIEYVFEDKKSIFTQREVGKDTLSMINGLQSAVREDANLVMVSEIGDFVTLEKVLDLAETGHLVIASMLTRSAEQTLEKMIGFYPNDLKKQAQERLAENLAAILIQDLVPKADQSGLVAVFELLLSNENVRSVIRRGTLTQVTSSIQSGMNEGMILMENDAYRLAEEGVISQEKAQEYAQREE